MVEPAGAAPPPSPAKDAPAKDAAARKRAEREAAALRENLRKRKQQARARAAQRGDPPPYDQTR